jgi:ATP-dependent helicase/nuclease subunit A
MTNFNDASLAQIYAANPLKNTWVSANAGSGKTRVLTDRVARLLLNNTNPQKILCLTYTKAAAAEMQNRLFESLGKWAMLPDEDLRDELINLGEDNKILNSDKIKQARTLFAAALETPGGLKIQTIHSFCDALLRQFPLEAGVSPQFIMLEERQAKQLRIEVVERMAQQSDTSEIDMLAKHFTRLNTDDLTNEIVKKRSGFKSPPKLVDFGISQDISIDDIFKETIIQHDGMIKSLVKVLNTGTKNDLKAANNLKEYFSTDSINIKLKILEQVFLNGKTAKAGPYSAKDNIATLKLIPKSSSLFNIQSVISKDVEAARKHRLAINAYNRTLVLHNFANSFLEAYDKRKSFNAFLDYDDLINLSSELLTSSSMAQWVLYKLDGGLDHILVDEAQDTSPTQWAVIDCLAREFTYGMSSNDRPRSLFIVGDEKQSIYSFQGADPDIFSEKKSEFKSLLHHINQDMEDRELLYSFRSAPQILSLVDQTFSKSDQKKLSPTHKAFHSTKPGRVDLWPFIEKQDQPDKEVWYRPVDMPAPNDPKKELARLIAQNIKELLLSKQTINVDNNLRAVTPGDILILVQSREAQSSSSLFNEILKELKSKNLPVAGADRLNVGDELAVKDILSILQFANMANDDLSLAEAMRSPLLGLSENDLFKIAHNRKGTLWQSLKDQNHHRKVLEILTDIRNQVGYLRPYELIERILTKHRGREKLLARLGSEVEDGIDELLSQSLQYETLEAPTLSGFLQWFVSGEVEIKRDMGKGNQIRVMTVHGSKGLESPIVILPDTGDKTLPLTSQITLSNNSAVWRSTGSDGSEIQAQAEAIIKEKQAEEKMRLLYVALTRAESWLIICGAGSHKRDSSWYNIIKSSMISLNASKYEFYNIGEGLLLKDLNWDNLETNGKISKPNIKQNTNPNWLVEKAKKINRPKQALAPSKLIDDKTLKSISNKPDGDAKELGELLHKVLEILPKMPKSEWTQFLNNFFKNDKSKLTNEKKNDLKSEAISLLDNPKLSYIFFSPNSLSEVGITSHISQLNNNILGYIDRLIIAENTITAIDFKSNVNIPDSDKEIPKGILAQQAVYLLALQKIYPKSEIIIAILWTKTGEVMNISHNTAINSLDTIQHLDDSIDRS